MAERKTNWVQKASWAGLEIILAACAKEIQNGQINSTGETPTNQPQVTGHKEGEFELNLTPPIIITPTSRNFNTHY